MSKVYMGQIMAECDCQHTACEQRGYCMASRIEELEAKLAKALEALKFYGTLIGEKHECPWHMYSEDFGEKARTTLAEMTGGNDDYHET